MLNSDDENIYIYMKERFFDEHICVPLRRENGPLTNVAVLIILEKLIGYFNGLSRI